MIQLPYADDKWPDEKRVRNTRNVKNGSKEQNPCSAPKRKNNSTRKKVLSPALSKGDRQKNQTKNV